MQTNAISFANLNNLFGEEEFSSFEFLFPKPFLLWYKKVFICQSNCKKGPKPLWLELVPKDNR